MRYFQFLNKLQAALDSGQGVDAIVPALAPEEIIYLQKNAPRLPALDGMEMYFDELATAFQIPTAAETSKEERNQAILSALPESWKQAMEATEMADVSRGVIVHAEAEAYAAHIGKGRAYEALAALRGDSLPSLLDNLKEAAGDEVGHGKLMHYYLHESDKKEEYRAVLQDALALDNSPGFAGLEFPIIDELRPNITSGGEVLAEILTALPPVRSSKLFQAIPEWHYKYGVHGAKAVLQTYPYFMNARDIENSDSTAFFTAARFGNTEIMDLIAKHRSSSENYSKLFSGDEYSMFSGDEYSITRSASDEGLRAIFRLAPEKERNKLLESVISNCLENLAQQHSPIYQELLPLIPPYNELSNYHTVQVTMAQLAYEPSAVSVESIRQLLAENDFFLQFENFTRTNPAALAKLAEVFPEKYLDYILTSEYCGIINKAQYRQMLIDSAPESVKEEVASFINGLDVNTTIDSAPLALKNRTAFNELLKDSREALSGLPDTILARNPHGFNYTVYKELLPLMKTAHYLEASVEDPEIQAYKAACVFGDVRKVENYLHRNYDPRNNAQPIHDALLFNVPEKGTYDLETWREFAMRDGMGPRALKLLPLAPKIEQEFAGKPSSQWSNKDRHNFKQLKLKDLQEIAQKVGYENSSKNPALALLCIELGVGEEHFEKARAIYDKPLPAKITPDIHIDGKDIGFPGFHFDRLAAEDPRCAFIGNMVNCCNHIGGHTERMAIAQIEEPECSLYVLTNKQGEPVAKCTGWMSKNGNFTFNAWERLSLTYDKMCEPFLLAGAVQAMKTDEKIERVTLGTNKAGAAFTPVPEKEKEIPVKPELASADAEIQYEVLNRESIPFAQAKLAVMGIGIGKPIVKDLGPIDLPAWQQRHPELVESSSRGNGRY